MKKNLFYLMLMLVMTSAASVNAQVLIGGNETDDPHAGAILDLASGGQNNLGLLLPNVQLTGDAHEFVLVPTAEDPEKQAATGMIVYNTSYFLKGPGVYLWNGTSWMPLRDPCQNSITDARDGNWYCIGDFGDAGTWMTQNLRYIPDSEDGYTDYSHGTSSDNLSEEKNYAFPRSTGNGAYPGVNNTLDDIQAAWESSEDLRKMGVFYNWAAAVNMGDDDGEYPNPGNASQGEGEAQESSATDVQGICPAGWHLPSDREWNDLEGEIALSAGGVYSSIGQTPWPDDGGENFRTSLSYRGAHGAKMKSTTPVSGDPKGASKSAEEGGFDALLAGYVGSQSSASFGTNVYFWASSASGSNGAWGRLLTSNQDGVNRNVFQRAYRFSVRCKQDELK